MKLNKLISMCVLSAGLLSPVLASAGPLFGPSLFVTNNTKFDSTSIINDGLCSSKVLGPKSGVTKAGEQRHEVTGGQLALACFKNHQNCKADIYMTDNCTGKKISSVVFSTSTGIKSFTTDDPSYRLTASGFFAQIDPA